MAKHAGKKSRFFLAMGQHELDVRITGMKNAKQSLDKFGVPNIYYTPN
jgi:hypothetical protein